MTAHTHISVEDVEINRFHKLLSIRSGGGWVMDGYILSIIGVVLGEISQQLNLSSTEEGFIAASSLIGIFFGGFFGGWLTDKLGRQKLYIAAPLIFLLCSLAQGWANSGTEIFIYRFLIGIGVGIEYPVAGSLLTEFLPKRYRGPRLAFLTVLWFAGAALAYIVGQTLMNSGIADAWRYIIMPPGSIVITLLFVVGCVIATKIINTVGRRSMVIHSFLWSGLALIGLGFYSNANGLLILVLFGLYALFIGGAQVLQLVYPNELFPTDIRAFAVGMGASLSRIGAAVGTWLVPIVLKDYGIAITMYGAAAVSFVGLITSLLLAPETKSLSLHEAASLKR